MRGRAIIVALVLAPALLACAPAQAKAPGRMLVTAREFSLVTSRQTLPAGRSIVQLVNRGQDPHDLALRRLSRGGRPAGATIRFPRASAGALAQRTVRLRKGRWQLWCTLPQHRKLGMRATLRVR